MGRVWGQPDPTPRRRRRYQRHVTGASSPPSWKFMWRCGDSNPVPPACKAGALPSELHPRTVVDHGCWWGILDSNQGPQSYQDCALTT